MDDSENHYNNDIINVIEAENILKTENIDDKSESHCDNDLGDSNLEENKRQRRRERTRISISHRYTDEDCNSILSSNNSDNNFNSAEDIVSQEPISSTTLKNSMSKRRRKNAIDTLGQALTEIGLFDELYEFMKSKGITAEALKYMQTRHIDELFRETRLSTKIVFEHNLKEWQNKNGICEVSTTQMHDTNINIQRVPLVPQLNMSLSGRLTEAEISFLSNHLTTAVQYAINKALQELNAPFQRSQQYNNNQKRQISEVDAVYENNIGNIKSEPNFSSEDAIASDKSYKKLERNSRRLFNTTNISNQSFETIALPSKRRKLNNDDKIINEILSTSQSGQSLVDEYKKTGVFTSNQRSELVRTIVEFYLRNNQTLSISLCKQIAGEIVETFPTETLNFYFDHDNKSKPPKGRIWDQYQSRRRSTRKQNESNDTAKEIKKEKFVGTRGSVAKIDWSDMESMCSEMKHISDENLLLEKWKDSFAFRRHQLQSGWFSNWKKFFDEYPFCKQQNYGKFIESDLDTLYPNLKFNDYLWDEFMKHFSTFLSNRIKHPQSKIIFEQLIADNPLENNTDYIAIKVVKLLHAVLKTYGKQVQSIDDAQRQFTVEVTDLSDLKKVVIQRKKACADKNVQAKPYIAVVGDNKTYTHFSVILDSTGFSCDNYKDSLILCFNLYLFFELSFPYESLNVWTFIQQYFFNKPTLVNNPRVESFIKDIKAQKHIIYDNNVNDSK